MELRKVQLTGGSSLAVTLPKHWTDRANVRAGDVVGFVEQPDGSVLLHPHAKGERAVQRYVIELGEPSGERLFRKIVAAYLNGYDVIVIRAKKAIAPSHRLQVRQAVRRIMGLEIVEEEPTAITLQDFLDPREFHLDKALRRMTLLAQAMQEEGLGALLDPNPEILSSLSDRDDEVDRLYWLVNKQYHGMLRDAGYAARMEMTASQALNVLLAARLVERTADHAARIAREALALPTTRPPDALLQRIDRHARRAFELFRGAVETFHRLDAKKANDIIDAVADFGRTQERLLRDVTALGGETVSHLAIILESIGRTAAYAADVAEVAINHRVASPQAE